ncbi:MAG: hypothetical protein Sylvanvirus1_3 [Sylvanvirus sp.]|uniref:Uncharacterized protein n=1 Tax=Sylvanvirus sp. TaxID=2487774 RepID=A0A3G5AGU9_9VIRU|nr:MAG: hypothetical protein Sylvanvirus1_3 [Sylvanvirus sp.]
MDCLPNSWLSSTPSAIPLQSKNQHTHSHAQPQESNTATTETSTPQTIELRHWSQHFGGRLNPVTTENKHDRKYWQDDRALCPMSVRNQCHKPHAAQLVYTHSTSKDPIQVVPITHHTAAHAFVHLSPCEDHPDLFCLTVLHRNCVYYLTPQGMSRKKQYVRVWTWSVDASDQDTARSVIIITDLSDRYVLQTTQEKGQSYDILQFDSKIPQDLFNAVFFTSPIHDFVYHYHRRRHQQ